jgi:hypothetical protein
MTLIRSLLAFAATISIVPSMVLAQVGGAEPQKETGSQKHLIDDASDAISEKVPSRMQRTPHEFATRPEGKVLPKDVLRARYIYTGVKGQTDGYDKDGNKTMVPLDLDVKAGAVVFEYGLTDEISLQFLQKFVSSYELKTNSSRALEYTSDTRSLKKTSLNSGICTTLGVPTASCAAFLASPPSAAAAAGLNSSATLQASAPGLTFDTATPISTSVSSYVDTAALKQVSAEEASGAKGLGDLEIGALWSPKNEGVCNYSIGAGFRIPMNKDLSSGESSITRNSPEFAVRTNLDLIPIEQMAVNWQNQAEVPVASGSYETAGTKATYTRKGVRNQGFLIVKSSLAGVSDSLSVLGPKAGLKYDFGNEQYVKFEGLDAVSTPRGHELKYYAGLSIDLFPVGAPLNLDLEYEKSFKGKNVSVATDVTQVQLRGYYKF